MAPFREKAAAQLISDSCKFVDICYRKKKEKF